MVRTKKKQVPLQPNRDKEVESFSVDVDFLRNTNRFDASHYNPRAAKAISMLKRCGMPLARLGDIAERVFIPPRFKRIYVEKEHGIPFIQGSHVVHFQPADLKYLSLLAHKKIEKWVVQSGWILVTCSGTIGRPTIVPKSWDGWAASQHLLRIIPRKDSECPVGYLYAFLCSFPGQAQLTSHIYGAVVDELTEDQAKSVMVPIPKTAEEREMANSVHRLALRSVKLKEQAVSVNNQSVEKFDSFMGKNKQESKSKIPKRRTIKLPSSEFQPSKAEMEKEYDMPQASKRTLRKAFFRPFDVVEEEDS